MNPSSVMMMGGLSALCAGSVGIMFLVAGFAKLREHDLFLGTLSSYRLLPAASLEGVAWALAFAEVMTGAMLLSGFGLAVGSVLAALMLLLFAGAMGVNVARGRTDLSCGCTPGQKGETLSWSLVFRTLACVVPALLPAIVGRSSSWVLQVEGVMCGVACWMLWLAFRSLLQAQTVASTGAEA